MEAQTKVKLNKKAHSAMILCLGNKVLREVTGETTATRVWSQLETLYMTKSLANKLYLKKKLYTFYMPAGRKISEHIDEFNKIVLDLANIEVKFKDEDLALLLLTSLPASYEHFVDTLLYRWEDLTLEDVMATLNLKKIKERYKAKGEDGEGLYVRGRTDHRDSRQSREKSRSKSLGGRLKCYICQSEDHLKRNCQKNNHKKSTGYVKKDEQPSSSDSTYDDSETLPHSDGDALVRMEELVRRGKSRDGQVGAKEKQKASSSNASEIRNPYVIKFSKRGVVNPDALQVQPTSNPPLQWNECSDIEKQAYNARLAELQVRNIATPKLVDWSVLDEIGFHLELKKMFRIIFKEDDELVFTCRAWWKAFKVKEDVYKEWCLEFFSTLWVDKQIKVENITSKVCIWFRLCGRNYEFTLSDFGVLLGLYTEDEINEPKFRAYLEAGEINFDKFPIKSFWESISKNDNGRKNEVSLRDPKLKLIHRLIVNVVLHRDYSRDKLFHMDVWLMSLIPERRAANVPWIITTYLFDRAAGKRGTSKIGGGHWVTRIVRNLRLFGPLEIKKCSSPLKSGWLDKKAFAGLIDKETNKLLPPNDDDENEHEENVEQEENVEREAPASSSQNVGGVDTSIVGSIGHGNDDVGAGPSHVTKLVEYADEMDDDDV
ncbi:hypothetical protein Tco_0262458 [Tanacetum coccineum]